MAGIGFRLQKILTGDSYTSLVKAYLYSSIIATGPLLVIMCLLAGIKFFIQSRLGFEESAIFQGIIVYIFAFSLVGVSPLLYGITRYLADKYYLHQMDAFTPTYFFVLEVVFFIQTLAALCFLPLLDLPMGAKWTTLCLYLTVNGIWIAMVFLSAARQYLWIVAAFFFGALVSILAAFLLGTHSGLSGCLAGYALGQLLTFMLLTVRIVIEFGYKLPRDVGVLGAFRKHPYLVLVGLCYNLGIWIDKFIFWFSENGETITPGIRVYSDYDTPMFLAFLSIVPSMAFFLIQMETSFVLKYQAYYRSVRNRAGLGEIQEKKNEILKNISENLQKYALFQGLLSSVIIIFVYDIAETFHLNPYQMGVFRIGILGAFLQMGFMMILNILFYFDFQKEAFLITLAYFLLNALLTGVTLWIGLPAYGFGYATAGLGAVVLAVTVLNHKLKDLDYWTFMTQPILIPKFKLESEHAPISDPSR